MPALKNSASAENPIKALREAAGVSRTELAWASGLGYSQIANAELGQPKRLPESWRSGIEAAGIDFDALAEAYTTWRFGQSQNIQTARA